jgi:sugar phosphate permease
LSEHNEASRGAHEWRGLLNRVQMLNVEQRYSHWKWRALLIFSGFYMFLYLGRFNFGFVIP